MWSWSAFFQFLFSTRMLEGAWTTIWLTFISMAAGLAIALVLALMRMAPNKLVRLPAAGYVWLFRGTPLLVQLIIIFTGLPEIGLRFSVVTSAFLGLALNEGAYLSEIVRAGIMSVPRGQFEAAKAIALSPYKVMRIVVLPQAARIMVPPVGNELNNLFKATSLASVISLQELLKTSQLMIQLNFRVLEGLVAACVYYLAMTTVWQLLQARIERRLGRAHMHSVTVSRRVMKREAKAALGGQGLIGEPR